LKRKFATIAFSNVTGLSVDECIKISGEMAVGIEEHYTVSDAGKKGETRVTAEKLHTFKKMLEDSADFFKSAAGSAGIWITNPDELSRALDTLAHREKILRSLVLKIEKMA